MVPDNDMPFAKDARIRADLLFFLKEATNPRAMQQTGAARRQSVQSRHARDKLVRGKSGEISMPLLQALRSRP
jgi:hypothetical protein